MPETERPLGNARELVLQHAEAVLGRVDVSVVLPQFYHLQGAVLPRAKCGPNVKLSPEPTNMSSH
ncbi:hypothetical protein P3T76_010749 [Phytophthora citrophthora]|uniref:Uncharacterized protein n=1 Tax=Phytophthora citrophthora TaxID=4793 RepID=A0AAD9GAQ6_9STRA|nr:hypothetical protein P3T76_010749 [Phytophthora citrophthora]